MSWSLSVVGTDAADAKSKLAAANEQQGSTMPEAVAKVVEAAVDALPASGVEGYDAVSVTTYGHVAGEGTTETSNINVAVAHVENTGVKPAA